MSNDDTKEFPETPRTQPTLLEFLDRIVALGEDLKEMRDENRDRILGLRTEMHGLRTEMHDRFERLTERIDQMDTRMHRVELDVLEIKQDIRDMKKEKVKP